MSKDQASGNVRVIPYPNNGGSAPDGPGPRVESGAVQFGNDWPGLFIRGDHAFAVAQAINQLEHVLQSDGVFNNAVAKWAWQEIAGLRDTIQQDVVVGAIRKKE